jgi:hypothetical protein
MQFSIDGIEYKAGKIDARKQFHIVRRLAPVMSAAAGGGDMLAMLAGAISKLSDDDADYVLFGLLDVVTRKQENGLGYAKISTGKALMFDDISMGAMLKIAAESFKENMQDFFTVIRSALKEEA